MPTLVHDGSPVIESAVIAEYLDEVFPELTADQGRPRWPKVEAAPREI